MARIAFISTMESATWGGSELLWAQTAARLAEQEHDVFVNVCAWETQPEPILHLQRVGCDITFRRNGGNPPSLGRRDRIKNILKLALGRTIAPAANRIPDVDNRVAMGAWLERVRPDFVVISQGYYLEGFACREACRERRIPFAPLVHSAGDHGWPGDDFALALGDNYEAATVNFFVSQGLLTFVRRVLATPIANARIVRNPYNLVIGDNPLPYPSDSSVFRLACVARLESIQKGHDLLIEVLRKEKWKARPLTVTLFGHGPNEKTLQKLAAQYGVYNVTFGGFTPDVKSIWEQHHALILPSRYEGLPIVIVEAMLCGRPCIVTDVMGSAELLVHGETGFVAEAPTPRHIDAALEVAWDNRHRWEEIGKSAGVAVRQQIPTDPVGVFAAEICRWAEGKGTHGAD